ncbi:hypothetical protein OPV22_029187 [Ensete ventricosum]|uniref:Uncharacterized protein n=1 Tax=Ensete ventricosum TaxID=4639 RepID=A0AAV8PWT3_ENSVE|nr:hypothetical protein OPV22_029187 [Ensete ventricosum]
MSLLLLFSFFFFGAAVTAASGGSAYEVLRSHGLPIGLLPKGVREFYVDGEGRFEARLYAPCTAKFESEVRYNASIVGTISPGQIAGLSGVAAQDLFLWFPVRAIRLDEQTSGVIHFDVGVVDKRFTLSLFEFPPDCAPALVAESQSGIVRKLCTDSVTEDNKLVSFQRMSAEEPEGQQPQAISAFR